MRSRFAGLCLLTFAALAVPQLSWGCTVCYGAAPRGPMVDGTNNAILFLLGVIGVVQIGFVALFLAIRKRARELARRRESFRLLQGGSR